MQLREDYWKAGLLACKHVKTAWIKSAHSEPAAIEPALRATIKNFDGIETIYAAAPEEHEEAYESLDFYSIAQLNLWEKRAAQEAPLLHSSPRAAEPKLRELLRIDYACWQDKRSALISSLLKSAACIYFREYMGFLFYGTERESAAIELWEMGGGSAFAARNMLRSALYSLKGRHVSLLSPDSNALAGALLKAHGFEISGSAALMALGKPRELKLENIFAL